MNATVEAAAPAPANGERTFFGQPRGLAYIVFTEAWERFSFYGMQALLVLYMTGHLLHPGAVEGVIGFAGFRAAIEVVFGQLSLQALATQIFGLYIGLIYFVPVLGGLLGDRVLGRRKAVIGGAVLMAGGHFLMAFEPAFLFALALLILGSGLLKGNLAAQVGGLYAKNDSRRDTAFSLYCMSINVGAFLAPLVCGTLGELYGWHYGFGAAGVGMLIGIAIYLQGRDYLPVDNVAARGERVKLQAGDGRTIAALLSVLAITGLFWTAQTQVWNTYPLWIRDHVDRELFGVAIPVTWFQSLDSLAVLVLRARGDLVLALAVAAAHRAGRSGEDRARLRILCARLRAAHDRRMDRAAQAELRSSGRRCFTSCAQQRISTLHRSRSHSCRAPRRSP